MSCNTLSCGGTSLAAARDWQQQKQQRGKIHPSLKTFPLEGSGVTAATVSCSAPHTLPCSCNSKLVLSRRLPACQYAQAGLTLVVLPGVCCHVPAGPPFLHPPVYTDCWPRCCMAVLPVSSQFPRRMCSARKAASRQPPACLATLTGQSYWAAVNRF